MSVKGIRFSRNFGKEAAIMAGLTKSSGDGCLVIDCDLQQFSDFFTTCVFFRGTILSCHNNYLQCVASILHHIGGLHKVWDGLRPRDISLYNPPFLLYNQFEKLEFV